MRPRVTAALAAITLLAVLVAACSQSARGRVETRAPASALAALRLYINPHTEAALAAAELAARGDAAASALLHRIADRPIGNWFTADAPDLSAHVDAIAADAARLGRVPVFVAYDIPHRDCDGYSQGGAADGSGYLAFIRHFAAGIDGRPAIVVLEPDAVPSVVAGCLTGTAAGDARLALLRQAVAVLVRSPRVRLYIDAGNSGWVRSLRALADALRRAGIEKTAGFSINVANFHSTAASIRYGRRLSRLLRGSHFLVDTGRNGNGPDTNPADAPLFCNPPGRALGRPPTTDPGVAGVDGLLWIKPPGNSDGQCRPGAPPAGGFWPDYALGLAQRGR